jgi:hypothetical protein
MACSERKRPDERRNSSGRECLVIAGEKNDFCLATRCRRLGQALFDREGQKCLVRLHEAIRPR